jgi:FtsH-binding integral membrane protein
MSYETQYRVAVENAPSSVRADFIKKTYAHLGLAVLAFVAVEYALFTSGLAETIAMAMLRSWILVVVGFVGVAYLADRWARTPQSTPMQYLGLGLYVVAEAIVFVPILYIAQRFSDPSVIPTAGLYTAIVFGGLTGVVFLTGKDFSFLRQILMVGGLVVLGLVVCSALFGLSLGLWFSAGMVAFASACILYQTSQIMRYYPPGAHVAASLSLFASVATLFYYILMILMNNRR